MSLRVGILGCGGIAARHAAAVIAQPEQLRLAGWCGRDPARTADFAARHGGTAYRSLDAMIDAGIDILVVATPPFARAGEVEHAAAQGVHLLVEKPIVLDLAAARAMATAVEATGVRAAVGFMYRHGDAIRAWRDADHGRIGMFAGEYHCNALHADWWREEAKSGGQIVEQVIHQIDLIRTLMGDPDRVYARRANLFHRDVPGYDAEDVSAIVFGWNDGRIATLNASNIATPGLWAKRWAVYAERQTGRFEDWNNASFAAAADGAITRIAGTTDPFVAQLADLASAIRDKREPLVPLCEGAGALRLALAARQSADEGREIVLAE
jgi:predicted dehydrogenase